MKVEYRYELTRKFPFVKKRRLTQLEKIEQRIWDYFSLIPIVYIVCFFAMIIGFFSSLLGIKKGG